MSAGIIAILQFALFTFLTTVAASVAVSVGGYLYAAVIEQTGGSDAMREKIALYSRLVSGFQDRLDMRKNKAAGSASQLFSAQRQEKTLKSRVRELETAHHKFVRIVGQEMAPNKPFEIMAMNTSVSHQVKRGEKHPFYDSSWARVIPIHIWSPSMEEAREEFERIYPKTVGFKLVSISPMPTEIGAPPGSKPADAGKAGEAPGDAPKAAAGGPAPPSPGQPEESGTPADAAPKPARPMTRPAKAAAVAEAVP